MATFTAATTIKHGNADGSTTVFEVGDTVSGLTKQEMKDLWDAGALEASDGTTSDAMQPDLRAEVRESVTPDNKLGMTVEEVAAHAPDAGEDTQKGTTDSTEKPVGGKEDADANKAPARTTSPASPMAPKATTAPTKSTTTSTTKSGPAAPDSK